MASVAGEGTGDNSSSSVLTRRMIDAFSEFERNLICERTRAAMQAKKKKNERVGHIPFGQRLSDDGIHLEEDDMEKSVLNQIGELLKEGVATRRAATEMNRRSAFNRGGSKWNQQSMQRLMKKMTACTGN